MLKPEVFWFVATLFYAAGLNFYWQSVPIVLFFSQLFLIKSAQSRALLGFVSLFFFTLGSFFSPCASLITEVDKTVKSEWLVEVIHQRGFFLKVLLKKCDGNQVVNLPVSLRVSLPRSYLLRGDRLEVQGSLAGNEFSGYQLRTSLLRMSSLSFWYRWRYYIYKRLRFHLFRRLGRNNSRLIYALLTGQRSSLSLFQSELMTLGCLNHFLAISGFHLGLALVLFTLLSSNELCQLLFLPLFMSFFGQTPSVIRAVLMTSSSLLNRHFCGDQSFFHRFCLCFFLAIFWKPDLLNSAGFILSCSAVAGIYCFQSGIESWLALSPLPSCLTSSLATGYAAQAGTLIPQICFFGLPSLLGFLLSPVLTLVFTVILLFSLVLIPLSLLLPPFLVNPLFHLLNIMLFFLQKVMTYLFFI